MVRFSSRVHIFSCFIFRQIRVAPNKFLLSYILEYFFYKMFVKKSSVDSQSFSSTGKGVFGFGQDISE